jgi:hypothetical protein
MGFVCRYMKSHSRINTFKGQQHLFKYVRPTPGSGFYITVCSINV